MHGKIKLFAGTGSLALAEEVSRRLGVPLSGRDVIRFPNENIFVRLHSSVRGQDVYLIQSTSSPVSDNLLELLIAVQTLKLDSAGRITVVIPYLAYARSDKKDQPRVPITARLVADLIQTAGADRYITLDLHAGQIQGFFSIPGDVLTTFNLLSDYFVHKRDELVDPVVVTADLGFAKKGRNFAAKLGTGMAFIEKRRSGNDSTAQAMTVIGDVRGRDVVIVDDEVDTGGSVVQAAEIVQDEELVGRYTLPDPLVMAKGQPVRDAETHVVSAFLPCHRDRIVLAEPLVREWAAMEPNHAEARAYLDTLRHRPETAFAHWPAGDECGNRRIRVDAGDVHPQR